MLKCLPALALLFSLTGCMSSMSSGQLQAYRNEFHRTIPTCSGAIECKAKWEAAQRWILQNLGLKIQSVTDVFIETYGPGPNGAVTAARVIKDPIDARSYRLVISTYCNNPLGCFPPTWDAAISFNRYVNAAPIPEPEAPGH